MVKTCFFQGRRRLLSRSYSTLGLAGGSGGGGGERRSLNSLLLHRAASSPTNSSNGKRICGAGPGGRSQQNLSIDSLSRLYAAAAAMELERSRKSELLDFFRVYVFIGVSLEVTFLYFKSRGRWLTDLWTRTTRFHGSVLDTSRWDHFSALAGQFVRC